MKIPSRMTCIKFFLFWGLLQMQLATASDLNGLQLASISSADFSTQTSTQTLVESDTQTSVPSGKSEQLLEHTPSLYNIHELASEFLENHSQQMQAKGYRSEISIGKIDPLLAERECDTTPNMAFLRQPEEGANINLTIQCDAPKTWKLYLTAEFKLYGPAVAASRPIPRGLLLSPNDFEIVERQINTQRRAYYPNIVDLVGMLSKRPIRQGALISPSHITAPKLIERGDTVTIIASNNVISVRMQGTAMTHGKKGQQISIKNNNSERIVKAYVEDKGLVSIRL